MSDWRDDPDFEVTRIKTVTEERKDGALVGWTIRRSDGWSFYVSAAHGVEPRVGQMARFYGRGIGSVVRGLVIDGREVFYRTAEQEAARHAQWVADQAAKKRRAFEEEGGREKLDAAYAGLPIEFQRRLDGFRARNPVFRWEHEPYESFCCVEAVKIARTLGSAALVQEFHAAGGDEQRRLVPELAMDEHSGNTFGMACRLASLYLSSPDLVEQEHGAICPLVGCVELGCWTTTQQGAA